MSDFYISRRLHVAEEVLSEEELLEKSKLLIILAAPGAGKTKLLKHFAKTLGVEPIRASIFRSRTFSKQVPALVIDALDEVAKIDQAALQDIIVKAHQASSGTVIFASRSGEWETASSKFVEDCFRQKPVEAQIDPFNTEEQKALFNQFFPDENFEHFIAECNLVDITQILGNPEFLQLFGYAYLENNRRFSNKLQIYADATNRLAAENNTDLSHKGRPEAKLIAQHAGSIFARLLLSGASGISKIEKVNDRDFPYIASISGDEASVLNNVLDSKLFKPTSNPNQHEPVHRIVAEYLAADYLVKRIADPADPLSLKRCFAIIAPNGVARDELRGMLGWMAALGNNNVQQAAINLDSYSVLSNGDPAQLNLQNKLLLLEQLESLSKKDPYFRRRDVWRSFNIGQFFTNDLAEALKPILTSKDDSHLRPLILELIKGTTVAAELLLELEILAFDINSAGYDRRLALKRLLNIESYKAEEAFDKFVVEGSATSLHMATEIIKTKGNDNISFEKTVNLFRTLATLYPNTSKESLRDSSPRYFIKPFLQDLTIENVELYLDALTDDIICTCNSKEHYHCKCRNGISKIVGILLDKYFQINKALHDPARVWTWIKNLRFHHGVRFEDSASTQALRENHELRQAIQRLAFSEAVSDDEHRDLSFHFHHSEYHAGIHFQKEDIISLVTEAFENDNVVLWKTMWRRHLHEHEQHEPDKLRTLMRSQARQKLEFLKAWSKNDNYHRKAWRKSRKDFSFRNKRYAQRRQKDKDNRLSSLNKNRILIKEGRHWGWLKDFASCYLYEPENFNEITDDMDLVHQSLRNCLPFLSEHVPTLEDLGQWKGKDIAMTLHAACVLHFREQNSLSNISLDILKAVKTECSSCNGISEDEAQKFEHEVDRLLFPTEKEIEEFARAYIEPSLAETGEAPTNVDWLNYKDAFKNLQKTLSIEWLKRFPNMPNHAENSLFNVALPHIEKSELQNIIAEHCKIYLNATDLDKQPLIANRRTFWFVNSFFYSDDNHVWEIIKTNRDMQLSLAARFDRFNDEASPQLSADKIYKLLDAFVDLWPKVPLPSSYGTSSPPGEKAYRFLRELPWRLSNCPPNLAIPILDKLLNDKRFEDFRSDLLTTKATCSRKLSLHNFEAPSPSNIANLLDKKSIASIEDLRAFMAEALVSAESQIRQAETNTLTTFYKDDKHVDENTARDRIVEHLKGYMTANRLSVVVEHHMAQNNRCDFTATDMVEGKRQLLVVEVKGQWHKDLFSAASFQLNERYASHPDAAQQGIYLVLWFGAHVDVANKKNTEFQTPDQLKQAIIASMPNDLATRIDVIVIDLSRATPKPTA